MGILGIRDLTSAQQVPELWDTLYVARVTLANEKPVTFGDYIATLRAAVPRFNQGLVTGQFTVLGNMLAMTTDIEVKYGVGSTLNGVIPSDEFSDAIPYRGKVSGHMLPLRAWERGFGWTVDGLEASTTDDLDADVRTAMDEIRAHWARQVLQRFFQIEPERVGSVANASPGFADGGLATSEYVPPVSPMGEEFQSTHMHYLRYAALDKNAINAALDHLRHHGHQQPYTIVASEADRATWMSLTDPEWVKPQYNAVEPPVTETRAKGDVNPYDGLLSTDYGIVRVWFTPLLPSGYFGAYKSYGALDPRNPLRVRWDKKHIGWYFMPGQAVNKRALALLRAKYGIGVGADRTNGVAVQIAASGSYTTPSIA